MAELHEILAERIAGWRAAGYRHDAYPTIAEILHYARREDGTPRYLREPQIRALETYWYLRLVERTPRIGELYERVFETTSDRLPHSASTSPRSRTSHSMSAIPA